MGMGGIGKFFSILPGREGREISFLGDPEKVPDRTLALNDENEHAPSKLDPSRFNTDVEKFKDLLGGKTSRS